MCIRDRHKNEIITTMKKYLSNDFDFTEYVNVSDECSIWSAPFGLKLLDYIDYKQNISALDIGFGTGFPLTEIALRLGESSTVYGIDPWTVSYTHLRAHETVLDLVCR